MIPPPVDPRRESAFFAELRARTAAWLPHWRMQEGEGDFGEALLRIAAFLSAQVTERLDHVPEKQALGLLDWLGIVPRAGRAARLPVVIKLGDKAVDPVPAIAPVRLQAATDDVPVPLETVSDLIVLPGRILRLVAVDTGTDSFFLPPPDLIALDPPEPGPTSWIVKSLAAGGTGTLQLSPGLGFAPGMILSVGGTYYEVAGEAKDGLVPVVPPVDMGIVAAGTGVARVATFAPYDGAARNRQEHHLYLGDDDALNLPSADTALVVVGGEALPGDLAWEYYGPTADGALAWQPLTPDGTDKDHPVFVKANKGEIAKTSLFGRESRWVRAVMAVGTKRSVAPVRQIGLQINRAGDPANNPEVDPATIKMVANQTELPRGDWALPFGPAPRQYDSFYLACPEAFAKPGARVTLSLKMADATMGPLAILSDSLGTAVFGTGQDGAMHRWTVDAASGTAAYRGARRPTAQATADHPFTPNEPPLRPIASGTSAAATIDVFGKAGIWRWTQSDPVTGTESWRYLGPMPKPGDADVAIEQIVPLGPVQAARRYAALTADGHILVGFPEGPWAEPAALGPAKRYAALMPVDLPDNGGTSAQAFLAVDDRGTLSIFQQSGEDWREDAELDGIWAAEPVPMAAGNATALIVAGADLDGMAQAISLGAGQGDVSPAGPLDVGSAASFAMVPRWPLNGTGAEPAILVALSDDSGGKRLAYWYPLASDRSVRFAPMPFASAGGLTPVVAGSMLLAPGDKRNLLVARFDTPAALPPLPLSRFGDAVMVANPPAAGAILHLNGDAAVALQPVGHYGAETMLLALDQGEASGDLRVYPAPTASRKVNVEPDSATAGAYIVDVADSRIRDGQSRLLIQDASGPGYSVHRVTSVTATNTGHTSVTFDSNPAGLTAARAALLYDKIGDKLPYRVLPLLDVTGDAVLDTLSVGRLIAFDHPAQTQEILALPIIAGVRRALLSESWTATLPATLGAHLLAPAAGWSSTPSNESSNPDLSWEYWNGQGWWRIGQAFEDTTGALKHSGDISFTVPDDFGETDVIGTKSHWIRARLVGGDYGRERYLVTRSGTSPEIQNTEIDLSQVNPPVMRGLRLSYYIGKAVFPKFVLTRDNGGVRDQSDANRTPAALVDVFVPIDRSIDLMAGASDAAADVETECDCTCADTSDDKAEETASGTRAFYLCLSAAPVAGPVTILFLTEEDRPFAAAAPLRLEAWRGQRFEPVIVTDGTRGLSETGIVGFTIDEAPTEAELFGQTGFWLRFSPRADGGDWKPSLKGVYLNAAWAAAAETQRMEPVGSSDGSPGLTLKLARAPVLDPHAPEDGAGLELRVREVLGPDARDALLAKGAPMIATYAGFAGDWVFWDKVDDLSQHGPRDRVYTLDASIGEIRFGDGITGAIPPAGPDAVLAVRYQRGGSTAADAIRRFTTLNLVSPIQGADRVFAAEDAAGGAAPQTPQELLRGAAATLRARDRIVSEADLVEAAVQSGLSIAQARVVRRGAEVRLVTVDAHGAAKLGQARERALKAFLVERASPTLAAKLVLVDATRPPFTVRVHVICDDIAHAGAIGIAVKAALSACFDPVTGGDDGTGWPIGAMPDADRAMALILDVPGVDAIDTLDIEGLPATIGVAALATLDPADIIVTFTAADAEVAA